MPSSRKERITRNDPSRVRVTQRALKLSRVPGARINRGRATPHDEKHVRANNYFRGISKTREKLTAKSPLAFHARNRVKFFVGPRHATWPPRFQSWTLSIWNNRTGRWGNGFTAHFLQTLVYGCSFNARG